MIDGWRDQDVRDELADMTEQRDQAIDDQYDQVQALETVKYWFLDVMVHRQPMTDPRKILRIVEEAL